MSCLGRIGAVFPQEVGKAGEMPGGLLGDLVGGLGRTQGIGGSENAAEGLQA